MDREANRTATLKLIGEAPEPARRQFAEVVARQEANRFDAAMWRINRNAGASSEEVEVLKDRILGLAD